MVGAGRAVNAHGHSANPISSFDVGGHRHLLFRLLMKNLFRKLRRPSVVYAVTVISMVTAIFALEMPGHAVGVAVLSLIVAGMICDPRY